MEPLHNLNEEFAAAPGEPGNAPQVVPKAALLHLCVVAAVLGAASLVPYADARLSDHRYWGRLDPAPLQRAVTLTTPPKDELTTAADTPAETAPEPDLASADLEKLEGLEPVTPGGPAAATPAAAVAKAAPAPALPAAAPSAQAQAALQVLDESLGDQTVWIEEDKRVMAPFYQALVDLASGRRPFVRIAHYGDSHIANDGSTHVTRQLLQRRFGDGGHGFTLVQGRTQWYKHQGVERSASDDWRTVNFLSGNAKDGAYGYGGVAADGGPGASFTLGSGSKRRASRFTLYYRSQGRALVSATRDRTPATALIVREAAGTDGEQAWTVAEGAHTMTWRVQSGRIRLFGGAVERERGIVYDSLGEVGARGTRWLQADADNLRDQMQRRPPDLIILNYGGNERSDRVSETRYLERMGKVVANLRAGHPGGACLILGPSDHGIKQGGRVISDPDVTRINGWQRALARQAGCGFFDTREWMGGDGSMARWVKNGLGWSDYSHFTVRGEQAMGLGIYRALLVGLRGHLSRSIAARK